MPGRDSARARCASRPALTTTTTSTVFSAADLEQQRHVDDRQASPRRRGGGEEGLAAARDVRVDDPFQPPQRRRVAERGGGEQAAIDVAVDPNAGKGRLDRLGFVGAVELAHRGVGVEHRRAEFGEHSADRRLAHRDRAGQAGDDHVRPFSAARRSASTSARNSAVTSGVLPNQRAKPGAAWRSSMPSPPTATQPRRHAASTSGVVSGT